MFEFIKSAFLGSKNDPKNQYLRTIPKLGIASLLAYVLLPGISSWINLNTTSNWYVIPTAQSEFLFSTAIAIIIFIWIFIYFLHSSNMRMLLEAGGELKSDKPERTVDEIVRGRITSVNIFSLLLTTLFFIQIWLHNRDIGLGYRTSTLLFVLLAWVLIFTAIGNIRNAFGSASYHFKAIMRARVKVALGQDNVLKIKKLNANINHPKLKENDLLTSTFLERLEGSQTPEASSNIYRNAYIKFTKELGLWSFTLCVIAAVLIYKTGPSNASHDGLPVIFFLTLLSFVLLFFWNLVFRTDITVPTLKALWVYWKEAFVGIYCLYRVLKRKVFYVLIAITTLGICLPFILKSSDTLPQVNASNIIVPISNKSFNHIDLTNPIIVVAASGGGIAAASWTSSSMRALEDSIPGIMNNVVAISGVSGGALGAYYIVAKELLIAKCALSYKTTPNSHKKVEKECREKIDITLDGGESGGALPTINSDHLGSRSSLGAVAWGSAAYELPSLLPYLDKSRADALMERWQSALCNDSHSQYFEKSMSHLVKTNEQFNLCLSYQSILSGSISDWQTSQMGVTNLLVNTTQQNSGLRTVLSTDVNFPADKFVPSETEKNRKISTLNAETYNSKNCLGVTATVEAIKHSATFPYVTAASHLTTTNQKECIPLKDKWFIDGGYLDNHGVATALDYIEHNAGKWKKGIKLNKPTIILLHLNAYPSTIKPASESALFNTKLSRELLSPLVGLAGIRKNQAHVNNSDIQRARTEFNIIPWEVTYDGKEALPLSWHLSSSEKGQIITSLTPKPSSFEKEILTTLDDQFCLSMLSQFINQRNEHTPPNTQVQIECLKRFYNGSIDFKDTVKISPKTVNLGSEIVEIIKETNRLTREISTFTSSIDLAPQWAQFVTPSYCKYSQSPILLAVTPLFAQGDSSSKQELDFKHPCQNQAESNCASLDNQFIHVIGLASDEGGVLANFTLAEKRTKWLNGKLVLNGLKKEKILNHPIGEGYYLPYIPNGDPNFASFSDPGYLNRYAFAFYCKD